MWAEGDLEGLKIEMGGAFSLKPTPKERVAMVLSGQEDGGQLSPLQVPGVTWPSPELSSEGTLPGDRDEYFCAYPRNGSAQETGKVCLPEKILRHGSKENALFLYDLTKKITKYAELEFKWCFPTPLY